MFMFSIFLPLLYLLFSNGDPLFLDNDVHSILFGDLAPMKDLFPKKSDEKTPGAVEDEDDDDTFEEVDPEIPDLFGHYRANLTNETFDLQDFVKINDMYANFSKQHKEPTRRLSWHDYDDAYLKHWVAENVKKEQVKNCLIQYVMHARYEVGKALAQRTYIRYEKRYKLGYLFNRMRQLKTEQMKMIGSAVNQQKSYYKQVYSLMRMYERVVHFDVDLRDTANMIKKIYRTPDPCDNIVIKPKKKSNATSGNDTTNSPQKSAGAAPTLRPGQKPKGAGPPPTDKPPQRPP